MVINSTSLSTNLQISEQWIVVRKCLVVDNVVISGATEDTGGSGLKSPDSNESLRVGLVGRVTLVGKAIANCSINQNSNQKVEAHTRAMSAQSLPPLKHYSDEGV